MMERSFKRPRLIDRPRIWLSRIGRNWPVLLWLGILLFVAAFYSRNRQFGEITGTVEVVEQDVAPLETARLVSIGVVAGQQVKAGDVLAQMDSALIDAELAVQDSTLRDARENVTQDQQRMVGAVNQAQAAVRSSEVALRTTQMQQQSDAATIEELRKEFKRREDLFSKRLIEETLLNELKPQIAALEQSLAGYPKLLEAQQRAWNEAVRQTEALRTWLRIDDTRDLSAAISNKTVSSLAIIAASRETVARRKEAYTLRAARDGVVDRILVWPGNIVPAGIPIMHLVDDHPHRVIGFLPEFQPVTLKKGQRVLVWRRSEAASWSFRRQSVAVPGVVSTISASVEALPVRVSPMQVRVQGGQPLRGRRIVFDLEGAHDFSPGETVEVHELHSGWKAILDKVVLLITRHSAPDAPPTP